GLIDELDTWITPLGRLLEGRSHSHAISERYRMELGLPETDLTRLLGPKVIRSMALVGSDPFLRQGSDVTLVFDVASEDLFRAGIAGALAKALAPHGDDVTRSSIDHRGQSIEVVRTKDGAV